MVVGAGSFICVPFFPLIPLSRLFFFATQPRRNLDITKPSSGPSFRGRRAMSPPIFHLSKSTPAPYFPDARPRGPTVQTVASARFPEALCIPGPVGAGSFLRTYSFFRVTPLHVPKLEAENHDAGLLLLVRPMNRGRRGPPLSTFLPPDSASAFIFSPKTTPRNPSLQSINSVGCPLILREAHVSWAYGVFLRPPPFSRNPPLRPIFPNTVLRLPALHPTNHATGSLNPH